MYRFLVFLLLLPCCCRGAEHKVFSYEGSRFSFKLYVTRNIFSDNYQYMCGIDSITLRDKTTGLAQTLICEQNGYNCRDTDKPYFIIEDMNFDGIEDIRLLQFQPAAANVPYYYWLYNAKIRKFEPDKMLEQITSPFFDQRRKCIVSEWRLSATEYGASVYEYINGKLIKTEETDKKNNSYDDNITVIVKKRVKGRMVVVSNTQEKAEMH